MYEGIKKTVYKLFPDTTYDDAGKIRHYNDSLGYDMSRRIIHFISKRKDEADYNQVIQQLKTRYYGVDSSDVDELNLLYYHMLQEPYETHTTICKCCGKVFDYDEAVIAEVYDIPETALVYELEVDVPRLCKTCQEGYNNNLGGIQMSTIKDLEREAQEIMAQEIEQAQTGLSDKTLKLMKRAKNHPSGKAFMDLKDGICNMHITRVTYTPEDRVKLTVDGIVWEYKRPGVVANFTFTTRNYKQAHDNISDIMEQVDFNFKHLRKYYMEKGKHLGEAYPMWDDKRSLTDFVIDREYTIRAHHWEGFLQLTFADYKFRKDIAQKEMELRLQATDPKLREKNKKQR